MEKTVTEATNASWPINQHNPTKRPADSTSIMREKSGFTIGLMGRSMDILSYSSSNAIIIAVLFFPLAWRRERESFLSTVPFV
jgi:anti-sigma regulatory factor (Ser/Thr protein kinase)